MKLIYFTNSYPYGIGEQWKLNELNVLIHYFEQITVVPFSYDGNFTAKTPINSVIYTEPLFNQPAVIVTKKDLFSFLLHRNFGIFFREFFNKRVYKNKKHFISWALATKRVIRLLNHDRLKNIIATADSETIFYFYWGKGSCEIMPFINSGKLKKSFIRMHRFDLFEYINDNYIPYRSLQLKSATVIAPSSLAGVWHLEKLYPEYKNKIRLFRCGTAGNGKRCAPSKDNTLRIVSCSFLSPVKRVHIMIEAMKYFDINVEWHHVGDGILKPELVILTQNLGLSDKFIFEGSLDSTQVLDYYTCNNFDYFVNVSESEGVPFSIMEAFSVGIPVVATDVGGTGEIVDDNVGALLPAQIEPQTLAKKLTELFDFDESRKNKMRDEAYKRYMTECNAEKLAKELGDYLIS